MKSKVNYIKPAQYHICDIRYVEMTTIDKTSDKI